MRGIDSLFYGGVTGVLYPVIGGFIPVLIAMYIVARWRTLRANLEDPQLGLKAALCVFLLVSFQVGLAGLFIFLAGLFDGANGDTLKTSLGVLFPAVLVFVPHWIALGKTNHREMPIIGRMFLGLSLIMTGMLGFVALIFLFQAYLQGEPGSVGRWALAMALVYDAAWLLLGLIFLRARVSTASPPAGSASGGDRPT